ncbi:unnamed protein product [Rotaria sp. Silwood1]|nr:unnamed protein product [Rotaria sp. Silwood1]CAF1390378.1 unnamed protein product [Rotaria sp. Silwood1]CAF3536930.1 unnamed protein product [Rotaria sp. Silwood1]CAF3598202.1 unnamed protein product [Rotaria sp. Silwood1]CAF4685893.1 unnamed protein product [Rotaria sp. Silwood1]
MAAKSFSKKATAVPNDFSEEEVDSSESEDEISKVGHNLRNELTINNELSSGEVTNNEENIQLNNQKRKKKKTIDWKKKDLVLPAANFASTFSPPPVYMEFEPIDYFYSMFGKESITLLTERSNLYSVQTNPNKPARISEVEMAQFIGVLIMSGIYCVPDQRFFWMNTTRVESISSTMS